MLFRSFLLWLSHEGDSCCSHESLLPEESYKMKDTMERAKLKSELDNLQRLVDRIPPDILVELKRQQRHTRER